MLLLRNLKAIDRAVIINPEKPRIFQRTTICTQIFPVSEKSERTGMKSLFVRGIVESKKLVLGGSETERQIFKGKKVCLKRKSEITRQVPRSGFRAGKSRT